jgi:glutamyl/glutaminyl-tRNA synthetase
MKNLVLTVKERKPLYREYADKLINSGWAYYAFDSAEALDAARKEQEEQGKTLFTIILIENY